MWTAFAQELEKLAGDKPAEGAPRAPTPPPMVKVKATKAPALAQVLPPAPPSISSNLSKTAFIAKLAILGRVAKALSKGEKALRRNKYVGYGVPALAGVLGANLALKGRQQRRRQPSREEQLQLPELQEF